MDKQHRICDGVVLDAGAFESQTGAPDMSVGWHQMALEGKWSGHWMGAFSLNEQMFGQMVEHFEELTNDTVVDYEHASVSMFGGGEAPAAGWIKELQVRNTEGQSTLWGRVEWTKKAASHIKEGEYKYLSPTIVFNTRNRKSGELTGASLHSVALTNTPFLDELPEVRLNSLRRALVADDNPQHEENTMNEEQVKQLAEFFGLSADASPEDILAKAEALTVQVGSYAALTERLGIPADAPQDEVLAAADDLKTPVEDPRVAELEAENAALKADKLMDSARKKGLVTAKLEEWATDLAKNSPEAFKKWVECSNSPVPTEVKTPPSGDGTTTVLNPEEKKACKALGLSEEDYIKFNKE